jgi:hypothetical protein
LHTNRKVSRRIKYFYVLFFCLSVLNFFQPVIIKPTLLFYIYYASFSATVLFILLFYKYSEKNSFAIPILLLLLAAIISGFMSYYYWDQNLFDSFKAISPFLFYILFFLLTIFRLKIVEVEEIFIVISVLYILVFTIVFLTFPTQIFGDVQGYGDERGFQRISLIGDGFLYLLSYYLLGRYLKNHQVRFLILFLISSVFIFLLLTRTTIVASILIFSLFVLRKTSRMKKILAFFAICIILFAISQMNFIKILVDTTQDQVNNINDNIRIKSAFYYINNFPPNTLTKIFGNGQAYYGNSYAEYLNMIETDLGLYQSDIGYIGLYSKYGLLAILAYLIIIYRTFTISIPDEYLYCKYFLYFVFLTSIIISSPFDAGFIPAIVLAIYILHSSDISQKENRTKSVS